MRRDRDKKRTHRGTVEIGEFSPPSGSSVAQARRWVSTAGVIASASLHVALLTPVIWGAAGHGQRPTDQPVGVGGSRGARSEEIALQWVTITEGTAADSSRTPASLFAPPRLTPIAKPQVTSPSFAAQDSDSNSQLQGQYVGQINARIDRAWVRPRSAIGDDAFRCEVRIEQDNLGNVKEVTLERCNGNSRWQLSLVHAIESASPLPAPPDLAVFAHVIHMSFAAESVESAASFEQYEPVSIKH